MESVINATRDLNISPQEGSRDSIFALRSKSHGPPSESRVSRRSEKLKISTPKKTDRNVLTVGGVKELDSKVQL